MKQQDTVFLLTLVDFLFQVIFFGLFVYAIYAVKEDPHYRKALDSIRDKYGLTSDDELTKIVDGFPNSLAVLRQVTEGNAAVEKELQRQGVSNITELTDELSRLAPVGNLAAAQKVVEKFGGLDGATELGKLVESAGGQKQAKEILVKYVKEGVGKPHCDPITDSKGKVIGANPLATITGYDNKLVFLQETAKLNSVLSSLGLEYKRIETLSTEEFKAIFRSVPTKIQDCVHTVTFREATRLVDARDAVRPYFRLSIKKVGVQTTAP